MREIFFLTILYFFVSTLYSQSNVEFVLNPETKLFDHDTLSFGLTYDTKKGKIKKRGHYFKKLFRSKKFCFSVKGAEIGSDKSGNFWRAILVTNKKLLEKNNNQIVVSYHHPKNKKIKKTDTISFLEIEDIKLIVSPTFTFGDTSKFDFKLTLKNGEEYNYNSNRFLFMLDRHDIDFSLENLSIENGLISAPNCSYDGLKKTYGKIIFYLDKKRIEQKINFNFNLNRRFILKGGAEYKTKSRHFYWTKRRDIDASDLQLSIAYVCDTLGHIKIKNQYFDKAFFFKPNSSHLYFDISGGDGEDGCNGGKGANGCPSHPRGERGENGENGKHGGDGGNCTINIDERIAYFIKDIEIINKGGKGGSGGSGGKGGLDYIEGKRRAFDILFPARGPRGDDGYDGHNGNRGELYINTILLDHKE